jgi:hypothetical protein
LLTWRRRPHVASAAHPEKAPFAASSPSNNKEARMARALTLSALYLVALGTLFGAYALAG